MPIFMQNTDRIVGGEEAPSPIPWQVSVRSNNHHKCGGTIIDSCTILSAAHCFDGDTPTGKTIWAGSIYKHNYPDSGQVH